MNFIKKWQVKNKCQKGEYPKFVCDYYEGIFEQGLLKNKPYEEIRYVVLDTETTGLNLHTDNLISIGAIVIQNKAILVQESFEIVLNEAQPLNADTVRVHGITADDIKNGVSPLAAIQAFLAYLRADVIVAHHTFFDVTMLNKAISKAINASAKLENFMLDTATLAKQVDYSDNPYETSFTYDLDSLCVRYNIEMHDRHTAWGDAYITARLFLILTRRLEEKGYKTLKDLLAIS